MDAQRPSKGKIISCVALVVLGRLGLTISSFYILIALFFHRAFDQWMPVRLLIIFSLSVLFLLAAARLGGDRHYPKTLFWQLPYVVTAFASLGLLRVLSAIYSHRKPHHLNQNELVLCITALGALAFCLWHIHQQRKEHDRKQLSEADAFVPSNIEKATQRFLRTRLRSYVIAGIVCCIAGFIVATAFLQEQNTFGAIAAVIVVFSIFGMACFNNAEQKLIIANDYLAYKRLGAPPKAVYFKDITKSRAHVLKRGQGFKRILEVHTSDARRPAMRIPCQAFKPSDIQWLTSLPEMKFHS